MAIKSLILFPAQRWISKFFVLEYMTSPAILAFFGGNTWQEMTKPAELSFVIFFLESCQKIWNSVEKFIWGKVKCFPVFLISSFDITFAINLVVSYLFTKCFAMFLIFAFPSTKKTHTSRLFSFSQELASPSLIR